MSNNLKVYYCVSDVGRFRLFYNLKLAKKQNVSGKNAVVFNYFD